jgi:hypothetical protein
MSTRLGRFQERCKISLGFRIIDVGLASFGGLLGCRKLKRGERGRDSYNTSIFVLSKLEHVINHIPQFFLLIKSPQGNKLPFPIQLSHKTKHLQRMTNAGVFENGFEFSFLSVELQANQGFRQR